MKIDIETMAVNSLRALSVDQVQKANSGHPGMALGAAPIMYSIWGKHLNFSVKNPKWINRDRFVLSAGHASALYYSILHLIGFDLSIDDLKQFRQFESKTPGHPEYRHTEGVEATTGPLGAGLSNAVGMAMAQEHLAAKYNRDDYPVFDNFTFVLSGDGCMMEGITSEASSLAGSLGLGRLIVIYDSNNTTIEGHTDLAFTESVRERYEAYGFETFLVEDGNDIGALDDAIQKAKSNLKKPSFIEVHTKIGYGSSKEGSSASHGAPLGEENVIKLKEFLKYPTKESFFVSESVYEHYKEIADKSSKKYEKWLDMMSNYGHEYPILNKALNKDLNKVSLEELLTLPNLFNFEEGDISTRSASGMALNRFKIKVPNLFGGSADLSGSTMTSLNHETSFSKDDYSGMNIHYGVREIAMAGVGNGIALYGGLKPYVGTFFVFSDYVKPMARLSSISELPLIYVLSHDSIGVGEDGPTHEPVEQLAMLRSMPNFYTFRPADAKETMYGWALALSSERTPVGLITSRQNLPQLESTGKGCLKGGYVIHDSKDASVILMASGSEVSLALDTAKKLEQEGINIRVVSMPCMELFDSQNNEYKESVLPDKMRKRIAIEAGSSLSWGQYVGLDGDYVCLNHYGGSAPAKTLFKEYGFSVENIANKVKKILK